MDEIRDAISYVSGQELYRFVETDNPKIPGQKIWVLRGANPRAASLIKHHRTPSGFRREDLLHRFPHVLWSTLGNLIISLLENSQTIQNTNLDPDALDKTLENLFNDLKTHMVPAYTSLVQATLVRLHEEHWHPLSAPGVEQAELKKDHESDKSSKAVSHLDAISSALDIIHRALTETCENFSSIFDVLYALDPRIFLGSEERYKGENWVRDVYEQDEVYQSIPTTPYIIAKARYSASNRAFGFDPFQDYHRPNRVFKPPHTISIIESVRTLQLEEEALNRKWLGMLNSGIGWYYYFEAPEIETFFLNPLISGPDGRIAFCFNDQGLNVDFATWVLNPNLQLVIDREGMDTPANYPQYLEALDVLENLFFVTLSILVALHRAGELSGCDVDIARSKYCMLTMLVTRLRLLIDFKIHSKHCLNLPWWDDWPQDQAVHEWYKVERRSACSVVLDLEEFDYSIPTEEVDLDLDFDQFEW